MNCSEASWEQRLFDQIYLVNNLNIQEYFVVNSENNVSDWALIQGFARTVINDMLSYYGATTEYLIKYTVKPQLALQQVFQKSLFKKIEGLFLIMKKMKKDIINTTKDLSKLKADEDKCENVSMFGTYCQLIQFMKDNHFPTELNNIYQLIQVTEYSLFDLIIFSLLHKSRSFHRIFNKLPKINSSAAADQIIPLITWYQELFKSFQTVIQDQFDPYYLPKRERRQHMVQTLNIQFDSELFRSVEDGDLQKFKELVQQGSSIDSVEPRLKMQIAHVACQHGQFEICKYLSELGIDWECDDGDKMSPLFHAIRSNNLKLIKYLCEVKQVNIEHKDIQDRTPFYYACSLGDIVVINNNVFIQKQIVRYLVQLGANINAKTSLKRSPLSKCCFLGQYEILEYLISRPDIDLNSADVQKRTALHNAVFGSKGGREGKKIGTFDTDCPEATQLLLENGVDVEAQDKDLNTPLHVAASSEGLSSIPILIAFNANINKQNKFGETPLMIAAKYGHVETAKLLIERYNANIYIQNIEQSNALDVSVKYNQIGIFQYLLKPYQVQAQNNNSTSFVQIQFNKIIKISAPLAENLFISTYYSFFKNEINFQTIDYEEFIRVLALVQDKTALKVLLENYIKSLKPIISEQDCQKLLQLSFRQGINSRNLIIFNELQQFSYTYDLILSHQTVESVFKLDESLLGIAIFECNANVLQYIGKHKETILHKLVTKRYSGILIQLLNYLQDSLDGKQIVLRNRYLRELKDDINKHLMIQEFIDQKDQNNSSAQELAIIHTYLDVGQVLTAFRIKNFDVSQEEIITFKIPRYKLVTVDSFQAVHAYTQTLMNLNQCYDSVQCKITSFQQIFQEVGLIQLNIKIGPQQQKIFNKVLQLENKELANFYYQTLNQRHYKIIQTSEDFIDLEKQLLKEKILGIDIENYTDKQQQFKVDFICTIQISTSDTDFIIDCLKLRQEIKSLKWFANIFENIQIIKIFHGCETDLKLLFSDFRISLMNLFDTSKAEMMISQETNSKSLQFLAKKYLDVHLDKQYQTSDWRIRPLPNQMANYAREDSAILLFLFPLLIYNCRNELPQLCVTNNKTCMKALEKCNQVYVELEFQDS